MDREDRLALRNRLLSLRTDSLFVETLTTEHYPLLSHVANLRCGSWYLNRETLCAGGAPDVYFKSTDGHYAKWDVSVKRFNTSFLSSFFQKDDEIEGSLGAVLVDATRSGKRFPDSLAKTIPIWCAIVNSLALEAHERNGEVVKDWDCNVHLPPQAVSENEANSIRNSIDSLVSKARAITKGIVDLNGLRKPLRPFWISRDSTSYPLSKLTKEELEDLAFIPLILVSASRLVPDGAEFVFDARVCDSSSFLYVQGSGDDEESWANGLTSNIFWKNLEEIMQACNDQPHMLNTTETENNSVDESGADVGILIEFKNESTTDESHVSRVVRSIVEKTQRSNAVTSSLNDSQKSKSKDTPRSTGGIHYTSVGNLSTLTATPVNLDWLLIGDYHAAVDVYNGAAPEGGPLSEVSLIINCGCIHNDILNSWRAGRLVEEREDTTESICDTAQNNGMVDFTIESPNNQNPPIRTVYLPIPEGKKGRHELRKRLLFALETLEELQRSNGTSYRALVHCVQGRDRSNATVVAMIARSMVSNMNSSSQIDNTQAEPHVKVTKSDVQRALLFLQARWPRSMPSRASMRAVTSVLCPLESDIN